MKLGRFETNNIYNEDSYKALNDLPDNSIDLVYIDIPYLYNKGGAGKSDLGQRTARKRTQLMGTNENYEKAKEQGLSNTEALRIARNARNKDIQLTNIEDGIDYSIFDTLCKKMKSIYIYIWCSKLQILDIMNYFVRDKGCLFEILTWIKTNPTPTTNNSWLPDTEYCLMFREKGTLLNSGYELKNKYYISPANVEDKKEYDHPTIKPLEYVKKHILHSTKENDVVLDCFLGSGTTAVACKETNRQYLGFELSPIYYQIAKDRLNGVSQKDKREEKEREEKGIQSIFDFM